MEWILWIALGVGVVVLMVVLALRAKSHGGGSVSGGFDFEKYKEGELARRGVYDKTKWR
jgi:hypothetical protein